MAVQENTWNVANRMHSSKDSDNPALNHIITGADEIYDDDKGKKQSVINAETAATLATHTSQIQGYNNQNYVTVVATSLTTDATDVLPAEGSVDTVYRVGNWDGTQYDVTCYSEYSWSNNAYQHISTKPQIGEVFDISLYKASGGTLATFDDLAAALDSGNNVPVDIRRGGMSVKFVHTFDNKYVQYRLMSDTFNTTVTNWQGVDEVPTAGSDNLVKSGGVAEILYGESNEESVSLDIVEGVAINHPKKEVNLEAGKIYRFEISDNRIASTKITIYFYDGMTNPQLVSCRFNTDRSVVERDGGNPLTFYSVQYNEKVFYLKPISTDVKMVKFYASASDVDNTATVTFKFIDEDKEPTGIVNRVKALENTIDNFSGDLILDESIEGDKLHDDTINGGDKIIDKSITKNKLEDAVSQSIDTSKEAIDHIVEQTVVKSANLFNKNDENISIGNFLINDGRLSPNAEYNTTGFIEVTEGKTYYFGNIGAVKTARFVLFYTSDKTAISSSYQQYKTSAEAPQDAAYLRITFNANQFNSAQVSEDELKAYEDWFKPYIVYKISDDVIVNINDGSVTEDKLDNRVKGKVFSEIGCFESSGTLSTGEYLLLPNIHIQKNNLLSCNIEGSIETVSFGVGYYNSFTYDYRDYNGLWIVLDSTHITQYRYFNNGHKQVSQVEHNMTLTNPIKLVMFNGISNSYVRLWDNLGNYFETPIQNSGCGRPFVYNGGTSALTCKLSDFPMDLNKDIWLFGDSYVSFIDQERWPYYFVPKNYINWLSNNQPGLSPETAYYNLINLLSLGFVPKTLVWLLGMNGSSEESQVDGQYVINSYQKTYVDGVKNKCDEKGINVIFGIIPTVPNRQKTGYGRYIKSLGVRYIDFAYAVGADSSGNWNSGLLSSDRVHPTAAGAKVLASQILIDCPELTITE